MAGYVLVFFVISGLTGLTEYTCQPPLNPDPLDLVERSPFLAPIVELLGLLSLIDLEPELVAKTLALS